MQVTEETTVEAGIETPEQKTAREERAARFVAECEAFGQKKEKGLAWAAGVVEARLREAGVEWVYLNHIRTAIRQLIRVLPENKGKALAMFSAAELYDAIQANQGGV
jgi:hypothetical protein